MQFHRRRRRANQSLLLLTLITTIYLCLGCRDRKEAIKLRNVEGSPEGPLQFVRDPASPIATARLNAIRLDEKGEKGWAVGGVVLHYDSATGWQKDVKASGASEGQFLSALWLDKEGQKGWAVGYRVVLHYDSATGWQKDVKASGASQGEFLSALWLDENSEKGWAVGGNGVVLHYDRAAGWHRDAKASGASQGRFLSALWLDKKGEKGWAVGGNGVVLHYDRAAGWHRDAKASGASQGQDLSALWLDEKSEKGWAVGNYGVVLHYDSATGWQKDVKASDASEGQFLSALWLDERGEKGWAVGGNFVGNYGVVLHYDSATGWQKDVKASVGSDSQGLLALWLDEKGERGWAVGGTGVVLHYDSAAGWQKDAKASGASQGQDLSALWLDEKGEKGWAVGGNFIGSHGVVLHYDSATGWQKDTKASAASDNQVLSALWLDEKGEKGWAVGGKGVVLHYDKVTGWQKDVKASAASEGQFLSALWLDKNGEEGWAVGGNIGIGNHGVVLHYDSATGWQKDAKASADSDNQVLSALWLDSEGEKGWALGQVGLLLKAMRHVVGGNINPEIQNLSGTVKLHIDSASPPDTVRVKFLQGAGHISLMPEEPQLYTIRHSAGPDYQIQFTESASALADSDQFKNKPFRVQIVMSFGPQVITLEPGKTLYIKGRYWLTKYLYMGLSILLLNICLVVGAIYSPFIRRLALDPVLRAIVGIGIFKYTLTEPLLVYVPVIRKALFRDYRKHVVEMPQLAQWQEKEYVLPTVQLSRHKGVRIPTPVDGEEVAQENLSVPDQAYKVFSALIRDIRLFQSPSKDHGEVVTRPIWLVEGQSGLGKSALLQQLALAALESGNTPLYIPLGEDQSAGQEVADLMRDWGELNVSAGAALDMVNGGGFLVLLDALDEDHDPQSTLEFVRKARKRNTVLVSSQYRPAWPGVPMESIILKPFGREQLVKILPEAWADKVLQAPHLAEVASLPITAVLLRAYIERCEALPASDYAIYENLSKELDRGQSLNLEQIAWESFKTNSTKFELDQLLSADFCQAAVSRGVLTVRIEGERKFYQFVHDKIHRYFVARYLARQDDAPLQEWHRQLGPGLGREYWTDVLEFRAAILANSEGDILLRTANYLKVLEEIAYFEPKIFAKRTYSQYQRYHHAGTVKSDTAFERWAAGLLAADIANHEPGTRASESARGAVGSSQ